MDVSPIQVLLIFIVAFIAGTISLVSSLLPANRNLVFCWFDFATFRLVSLLVVLYQLMTIGNMPAGAQPPPLSAALCSQSLQSLQA